MTAAHDVINAIRRQFFIGMELSSEAEQAASNMRATLHRALEIVSKDLYSRETHFVFELVQNADDNRYAAGVTPEVTFSLTPERIIVTNNEVGFSPDNVRALCTVGDSTKARKADSIGEKGIGFKSVFAVSDRPEIHSNGFHFCFDVSGAGILGYIVPEWIDGCTNALGTTIVLPAKQGRKFKSTDLSELSAQLLLFLRRLRYLTVADAISQMSLRAERRDHGNRMTLTTTAQLPSGQDATRSVSTYLRVEHAVSMVDVVEEKRPGMAETCLVLAFPIAEDGSANADSSQSLFAFLPIRTVGFKFIVQADFILSSSREDIHTDRPWNERIRDEIANAFAAAVPHLKHEETFARSFFDYVPGLMDVADPFFDRAADEIAERLAATECVQGRSGVWHTPAQILLADTDFQSLFSDEDISRVLGLEYPGQSFTPAARATLVRLGAQKLALSHVIALLKDNALLVQKGAPWFSELYDYLARTYSAEASLKRLRSLPFVRLNGGSLKSAVPAQIFFPLAAGRQYGFEGDLDILDRAVSSGSKDRVVRIREFLTNIGVQEASPYALIENHILPKHSEDAWKSSTFEVLAGHVAYVKDHLLNYIEGRSAAVGGGASAALERLRTTLFVRTKKTVGERVYFNRPNMLYLPSEYSPEVALEELLPDSIAPEQFVAPTYLERPQAEGAATEGTIAEWREFFYRIGVKALPAITQTRSGSVIDFDAGAELKAMLVSAETASLNRAICLIDRNWHRYYGQFAVRKQASGAPLASPSAFVTFLRQLLVPTTKRHRTALGQTFLDSDALRVVFGKSPAYLAADVTDTDFMDAVGITHRIDAAACIRRLDQLRERDNVSVAELRALYRALEERLAGERSLVIAALGADPRVYAPAAKRWCRASEVVWESSGALLDGLHPPLEYSYPEHRTFFCRHVGVVRRPSEDAMVSALKHLPRLEVSPERREREAYAIYKRLSESLREGRQHSPDHAPDWVDRMRSEAVFLDHVGRLVGADNDLYIDDDPRLSQVFAKVQQVSFVPIDRAHVSAVRILLDACKVPLLTESVRYERVSVSEAVTERELSARVRARARDIMRFFFHCHHPLFAYASQSGTWKQLSQLEIQRVADLTVDVHLANHSSPLQVEILREGHIIYLRTDARVPRDKLCTELCAMLGARSEVADALYRIVFADADELDQFFEARGIEAIPQDELAELDQARTDWLDIDEPGDEVHADEPAELAESTDISGEPSPGSDVTPLELPAPRGSRQPRSGRLMGASPGQTSSATEEQRLPRESDESVAGDATRAQVNTHRPARSSDRSEPSSRLLSYAEPHSRTDDHPTSDSVDAQLRREVSAAAVSFVVERERAAGHEIQEMAFNNEGFDLQRIAPDGSIEYIEVKGCSGLWTEAGVIVTPKEVEYAGRFRERYFLYVVEFATDPERRRLFRIQDPFGKVAQFRFDSGWKAIAETSELVEPVAGFQVEFSDGTGTILEVRRAGRFFALQVQCEGAPPRSMLFVPGKMRLRRP